MARPTTVCDDKLSNAHHPPPAKPCQPLQRAADLLHGALAATPPPPHRALPPTAGPRTPPPPLVRPRAIVPRGVPRRPVTEVATIRARPAAACAATPPHWGRPRLSRSSAPSPPVPPPLPRTAAAAVHSFPSPTRLSPSRVSRGLVRASRGGVAGPALWAVVDATPRVAPLLCVRCCGVVARSCRPGQSPSPSFVRDAAAVSNGFVLRLLCLAQDVALSRAWSRTWPFPVLGPIAGLAGRCGSIAGLGPVISRDSSLSCWVRCYNRPGRWRP